MNIYREEHIISSDELDSDELLSYRDVFALFQNMWTEDNTGVDRGNFSIRDYFNAFWIISKYKIHINRRPRWHEKVMASIWIEDRQNVRLIHGFRVEKDDEVLFEGKNEACVLSFANQHILTLDQIDYPRNTAFSDGSLNVGCFSRFAKNADIAADYSYQKTIRYCDIDMSHHTNNLSYIQLLLNVLPCEFYKKHALIDFEIHYLLQSHEGDVLNVTAHIEDDLIIYTAQNSEGNTVVKALAKIKD